MASSRSRRNCSRVFEASAWGISTFSRDGSPSMPSWCGAPEEAYGNGNPPPPLAAPLPHLLEPLSQPPERAERLLLLAGAALRVPLSERARRRLHVTAPL